MKKDIIAALESAEKAYKTVSNDRQSIAPQFRAGAQAKLALTIMNLTEVLDMVVENEQINGGTN